MPKKTGHKKKRSKRAIHHHAHPAGGHHDRLRKSLRSAHAHGHKRPKRRATSATAAASKRPRKASKRTAPDRRVTEQTLRDHMALACVRRCSH
jgi:hypothetical protein